MLKQTKVEPITHINPKLQRSIARPALTKTNTQLLTTILGDAQLAHDLIAADPQLHHFANISDAELASANCYDDQVQRLQAAIEFGRRAQRATQLHGIDITSSQMVGDMMVARFAGATQEELVLLTLDTKNKLIDQTTVFRGTLNASIAHPRELMRHALQVNAARIMIVHNHPSGSLSPSSYDQKFTERLADCGELMGIELLDHIIAGADNYYSFKEHDDL